MRFDHSFRSGANVLGAVDEVFRSPEIYRSITSDRDGMLAHQALPGAAPGVVEIWPLIEPEPAPEIEGWDAPFDAVSETSPQVQLARKIAATVRDADRGARTPVGRERRPMRAGDVLVLVRQRGALFEAIIRALKNAGVAVAGADRLVLTEHIAIVDLMALADALLLAAGRSRARGRAQEPAVRLRRRSACSRSPGARRRSLRADARGARRRDAGLRRRRCAAAALRRRWRAAKRRSGSSPGCSARNRAGGRIFARLGLEAADALDEFLELALDYERRETPSLQGFVGLAAGAPTSSSSATWRSPATRCG